MQRHRTECVATHRVGKDNRHKEQSAVQLLAHGLVLVTTTRDVEECHRWCYTHDTASRTACTAVALADGPQRWYGVGAVHGRW